VAFALGVESVYLIFVYRKSDRAVDGQTGFGRALSRHGEIGSIPCAYRIGPPQVAALLLGYAFGLGIRTIAADFDSDYPARLQMTKVDLRREGGGKKDSKNATSGERLAGFPFHEFLATKDDVSTAWTGDDARRGDSCFTIDIDRPMVALLDGSLQGRAVSYLADFARST
jgi:hypothetical protein